MTLNNFRILCLLIFLVIFIPTVFFTPIHINHTIFNVIAGWQIGRWVYALVNKLADKFGYTD